MPRIMKHYRTSTGTTSDRSTRPTPRGSTPTLASDFLNTNPDGTLIDRSAFIAQIGRGSSVKNIREHDVIIRFLAISRSFMHAQRISNPTGHPAAVATQTTGCSETADGSAFLPTSTSLRL